jgi:hypothetical protein
MKTTPIFSRQQLGKELASVLPEEGSEYFAQLQQLRFNRHPFARYTFLSPDSLTELVQRALDERGSLGGDDRRLMQMGGLSASAFSLDESHRYLTVPAEGRVASMDINELPEWVPVTVQAASILPFSLMSAPFSKKNHLTFSVDADFQRHVNYATLIIAPNWFDNPSTELALLDAFPGPPSHGNHSLAPEHRAVKKLKLKAGHQVTVGELRRHLKSDDGCLLLGCSLRNLPGS